MITDLLNLKRNPRLDGLQLQPHALRREQFWRDAGRAQRASWTRAQLTWPVQPITHEEVFHRYQHGMGLLFCHHGPTCLYLQVVIPISHAVGHIDLFDERCRNLMIDFLNWVKRKKISCIGDTNFQFSKYLNKSVVSFVQIGSHVDGLRMERGIIAHKYKRPALQFLQSVGYIMSPANYCKAVHLIVRHGLRNNSKRDMVCETILKAVQ